MKRSVDQTIYHGYLTATAAARLAGVSPFTLNKWIKAKLLLVSHVPCTREIRVVPPSLVKILETNSMPVHSLLYTAANRYNELFTGIFQPRTDIS